MSRGGVRAGAQGKELLLRAEMGWRSEAGGREEAVKDWVVAWAKFSQWGRRDRCI